MGKLTILLVILTSDFLLACASQSPASTPTPVPTSGDNSIRTFELKAIGPEGPAGPAGAAGPPGPAGAQGGFATAESSAMDFGFGRAPAAAMPAPTATPAPARPQALRSEEDGAASSPLQTTQRMVISTASISVEVEVVPAAINEVRAIAESLGGFVEQLSSSGGSERQQAHMTIRVPQSQFFTALERIEALGEVQNRNLGSEDVSEQFIDLEARLKSALREEQSLLSLLERAQQVSEILTIERELSRVRSEIERLQGQLNFLERRVELATITVSLFPPSEEIPQPPSASLVVEDSDVTSSVNEVKNLVSTLGGEVDQVFLLVQDGRERANISFWVFPKDFAQAVAFLESQGEVRSKELREGTGPIEGDAAQPEEPNARIDVSLVETEPSDTWLIIAIAASIGGVMLAAVLGVLFYLTYQAGRRRRDRFV